MTNAPPTVYKEFCRRPHLGPRHGGHLWKFGGRWRHCPGSNPDAPTAPDLTLDLLIAKYQGHQEGLRATLLSYNLGACERETVQAQFNEVNDFLTDLQRLRATQEG